MVRLQTLALLTFAVLAALVAPSHAFVFAPAASTAGAGRIGVQVAGNGNTFSARHATCVERKPLALAFSPSTTTTITTTTANRSGAVRRRTALGAGARQVTAEELEKEMTEWDLPLILDVFAVWCGPCLMLKPEIEKVAQALDGKCRVLKMDSDDESEMASALNVYGLPTVLYMKDGVMKHRTEGSMPAEEILQLADIHLFDVPPPTDDAADDLFIDMSACAPASPAAADACAPADACQPVDACKPAEDASSACTP